MPRYANSGPAVNAWYARKQEGSSTFDLCIPCGKKHESKPLPKGCVPYQTGEPSGVLEEMDGPPDLDTCEYRCCVCNRRLYDDNYYPKGG